MIGKDTILLLETNFEYADELIPTTEGLCPMTGNFSFGLKSLSVLSISFSVAINDLQQHPYNHGYHNYLLF